MLRFFTVTFRFCSGIPERIRFAAVGMNVLSIGLIVWMIHLFTKDHYNFFLLGIMTAMALFSLFKKRTSEN